MQFQQQVLLCSRGLPIAMEAARLLMIEGYDPNQYAQASSPQPEQKSSTLGKIAKWGGLGLGAAALGGLGYAAFDPHGAANALGSAGDWMSNHGMGGAGEAVKNFGGTVQDTGTTVHNAVADRWNQFTGSGDEKDAYNKWVEGGRQDGTFGHHQDVLQQQAANEKSLAASDAMEQQRTANSQAWSQQNQHDQAEALKNQQAAKAHLTRDEFDARQAENQKMIDAQNQRSLAASDAVENQRAQNAQAYQQQADQQRAADAKSLAASDQMEGQRLRNQQAWSQHNKDNPPVVQGSGGALHQAETRAGVAPPPPQQPPSALGQAEQQMNQQSLAASDQAEQQRMQNQQAWQQHNAQQRSLASSDAMEQQRTTNSQAWNQQRSEQQMNGLDAQRQTNAQSWDQHNAQQRSLASSDAAERQRTTNQQAWNQHNQQQRSLASSDAVENQRTQNSQAWNQHNQQERSLAASDRIEQERLNNAQAHQRTQTPTSNGGPQQKPVPTKAGQGIPV